MKVWFKRGLVGLVVVVIVALVGLAIFLLTFDPNAYKNKLEEIVYNRYHRTLAIKGDIKLSLFPRIGLSLQGVSLSDRESTNTFASIDSARFAVAIWPLMSNRLVVDHVAVSGFKGWVVRNRLGQFNFQDLMGSSLSAEPATDAAPGTSGDAKPPGRPSVLTNHEASRADFQIDIAGLDLKNGEIHFRDVKTGSRARVEKLEVNTGRMTFDQPFDVALKGKLIGVSPVADANIEGQAVVKINPEQQTYSAQKLSLQVSGMLDSLQAKTVSLKGNLAYSAYSQMFTASNLELAVQGAVDGKQPIKNLDASLSVPQLKVDRSQSELKLEKLALRAKGVLPTQNFDIAVDAPNLSISPEAAKGDAISGTVKLSGQKVLGLALGVSGIGGNAQELTLKELKVEGGLKEGQRVIQFNISSPANWSSIKDHGGLSAIKGDVKISDPSLAGDSFEFPLIGSLRADLVKDQISSEINAVLSGSKLDFKVKATQLRDPKVTFDLVADTLDFNKLFPPTQAKAAAAPAADGKTAEAAKPAAPSAPAKAAAPAVPAAVSEAIDLSALGSLDVNGNIKVGHVRARQLDARQFSAGVRVLNGMLTIAPLSADLYGGKLSGKLSADVHNSMAAQLTLDKVAVGDLLQGLSQDSRLTGTGNIALNLHAQGATTAALKAGLTGTVQATIRDGAVKGINISQTLREVSSAVENVFSGQVPDVAAKFDAGRQTDFTSLDASLAFNQGQGTLKKLSIVSPLLRISEGTPASIDLVNQQADIVANVRVVNTIVGQGGKELADLKGVTIPIRISGPFDKLGYQVQWKEIGSKAVKQAVQDGLLDLLSNKVGKDLLPQAAKPAAPAPSGKSDAVKSIGNALKGLLGQ
ncbi:AsmA family protein [Paralcaligenes sp. KSB-10]|uniref:AsmA family protein n=1 Tax=Paralcaligenes sp. KSB-10 TaxID=2901142 RepID=UPI001E4D20C9|nr:AsmA family protein [Paralcaligenes sp. KSB-10]UHL64169.1 AsmA family protein [Paralcaligenes sp. KSB-10]